MKLTKLLATTGLLLALSISSFAAKGDNKETETHKGKPVHVAAKGDNKETETHKGKPVQVAAKGDNKETETHKGKPLA